MTGRSSRACAGATRRRARPSRLRPSTTSTGATSAGRLRVAGTKCAGSRSGLLTRDDWIERFGEVIGKACRSARPAKTTSKGGIQDDPWQKGEVWEIWCREEQQVYWCVEGMDVICDAKHDPLKLKDFFPAPAVHAREPDLEAVRASRRVHARAGPVRGGQRGHDAHQHAPEGDQGCRRVRQAGRWRAAHAERGDETTS